MSLSRLVDEHRVVVCVGSGGVGKTTSAAALALFGASRGRRSMVLTIDPAQRLAQALGLGTLAAGGELVDDTLLREAGVGGGGSLSAGMLEQKSAWDEFIVRHAPSAEAARVILDNEFYKHLSESFAGSTEYMAIEELCRIVECDDYDLVVLDTPPTAHALDFLEAPQRLQRFLDRSVVGWMVKPSVALGRTVWKRASRSVSYVLERLEDATGLQALREISEFFVAMDELFDGIAERSARVGELLRGSRTAFVLIVGPDEQVLDEADYLSSRMRELGMPLKGVVMNRIQPRPGGCDGVVRAREFDEILAPLRDGGKESAALWLEDTWRQACRVAVSQELRLESFEALLPESVSSVRVPELNHDVHALVDLRKIYEWLCP